MLGKLLKGLVPKKLGAADDSQPALGKKRESTKRSIGFSVSFGIGMIIVLSIGSLYLKNANSTNSCKQTLKVAAGLEGGDSYVFASEMKALVENNSEKNICIDVLPGLQGTRDNLDKLNSKQADLAMAQADILVMNNLPRLRLDNQKEIDVNSLLPLSLDSAQMMSLLFQDVYQLIVRGDSSIKTISDLKPGKKVAMPPARGGQIISFTFLMQHYGLITEKEQQVKLVEVGDNDEDLKKALCEKENNDYKVDAVFQVRAVRNQKILELLRDKQCNARLVPIDQATAITGQNLYLKEAEIPEGAYGGDLQKQKVKTVSVPRLLLVHKDVDKEVIQQITKILYEHQQELVKKMPLAANMSPPNSSTSDDDFKGIGLPIHPGAQAYYDREKPHWIYQNSGIIGLCFSFVLTVITVRRTIALWLKQREQRRKNKADDYILEVTALMDAEECVEGIVKYINAKESNYSHQLKQFRDIIAEKAAKILVEKQVAELAITSKLISTDSLKSFSKTLRKVVNAIEKMPEEASEEIFNVIPERARQVLDKRKTKDFTNQLLPLKLFLYRLFRPISLDELANIENEKLKINLDKTLQNAKTPTEKLQPLQEAFEFAQFLESESLEIRRDLDSILKRAVNALIEERISQESFQSFRVIWQIAKGDVDREKSTVSLKGD